MECIWKIHVPEKSRVEFNFSTPIYFDPNCTDVIEIRDGLHENSPLLKRYCASSATPNGIVSTGREMFVRFKSDGYIRDHEVSMAGFNASYYAVDIKSGMLRDLALFVTRREGGEEGRGSESLQTEYRMGTLKFLIWTCRLIFSITLLTFFLSILRRRLPQDMFLFEFYLFSNFLFGLLVILITESKSVNFVLCAFN